MTTPPHSVRPFAALLTINAGSSSLKFALFENGPSMSPVFSGAVRSIGQPSSTIEVSDSHRLQPLRSTLDIPTHLAAFEAVIHLLDQRNLLQNLSAIGHRIVHGGGRFASPTIINPDLLQVLESFSWMAPQHLPSQLALVHASLARFPQIPQTACFDTAFHRDLPQVAHTLPIPRRFHRAGVQRYGFHGLSYQSIVHELQRLNDPAATQGRLILAHLGHGCSMAAVADGRCVDTTMAFTPAAGLMMPRRSGDVDPGLFAYLARSERPADIDRILNEQSGLLGVSELSSDLRDLLTAEPTHPQARLAVDLFCYIAKKWIGAFAAALGGLDALVFSGGIGENNPPIRSRVCSGLKFLGVVINEQANNQNQPVISSGPVRVRVVPSNEERVIAQSILFALNSNLKSSDPIHELSK